MKSTKQIVNNHTSGELSDSLCLNNQTAWLRRRDGGFGEGGIGEGEILEGEIEEGACEETFLCLSLTLKTCRFTMPPVVALLNYISCGILWWIFCQTGIFRGVFSTYHY